mgnify:FL=1
MQLETKEHNPPPGKTKKVTPSSAKEPPELDARSALRSSSQPSAVNDPSDLQPSTPTRKRLEYPVDHSPTVREAGGDLHDDFSVPVPEGVGLEDLDILSELCDDPLLTAEDAVEILETLDALSAQQARSESWAATLTITRTRACIRSCVAQLKQGMCVQQSVNDQPDADSTSTPTVNHLVDPATHGSTTASKISQKHLQTLTTTPTSEQPPPPSLKKGMCVQQLVDAQSDANSTSTPSVDHLTEAG